MVKNLPAMWETWVRPLGWEDPVEKGMTTYSSVLAWRIPWTEQPGPTHQELDLTRVTYTHLFVTSLNQTGHDHIIFH